jgi:acetyl esterase
MEWFQDAYTTDPAQRAEITASPNQASTERLIGLPPAFPLAETNATRAAIAPATATLRAALGADSE